MNGDGDKELCVNSGTDIIYIFEENAGDCELWKKIDATQLKTMGTTALSRDFETQHMYYEFDEEGLVNKMITFSGGAIGENGEEVYLITWPDNESEGTGMQDAISYLQRKAYYNKDDEKFYFRVTKEQYDELTERYFEAQELAKTGLEEVHVSYEELVSGEVQPIETEQITEESESISEEIQSEETESNESEEAEQTNQIEQDISGYEVLT